MNTNQPLKKFNWISHLAGWALLVSVLSSPVARTQAQYDGWSFPQTMPSFDLDSWPPILLSDQDGNVHAFSSQYIESRDGVSIRAVVYNKWNLEAGWTPPIDILLSPIKEARLTDAYLDDVGIMHLAFFGGDGTGADIYYSQSPLAEVDNPRAWSKPIIIGDKAGDPEGAVFTQNGRGGLTVIFNGRQYGNGVYAVSSQDRGNTWSFPTPIFITTDRAPNVFNLKVIESNSGWLHLIWNVFTASGQARAVYYARSPDGLVWDQPVAFAEAEEGLGPQTPTLIEHNGALFAFYNIPVKIVMQRSFDNGETWQDPAMLFPRHIGVNGSLSPVIDGNNTLHLFFGQRIPGSPDIHGLWHSVWVDPRWTEPEALIKGPKVSDDIGNNSFDPNAARAVVLQGNVILVTWRTDPGAKGNGVWYSYQKINAPELPVLYLSTPTVELGRDIGGVPGEDFETVPQTPSGMNDIQLENQPRGIFSWSVILGLLFVLCLMFMLAVFLRRRSS